MEALLTRSVLQLLLLGLCIGKVIPQCANSPKSTRCHERGCYLEARINGVCKPCQNCSEQDLRETSHPRECRAMSYPQFCKYPARNENDVPTKMVEVQLDSPLLGNFSQRNGKWVVFFYNELAEEGKQENYARVGKVCSQEWQRDKSQWNTFQKARLLCRSGDEEFNYLTDIKRIDEDMSRYYGIFSQRRKGSTRSAVCSFTPGSIVNAFSNGNYCDPGAFDYNDGVHELYDRSLPKTKCNGKNLTDWETAFIRTHPLMSAVVTDDAPLLIADRHFTKAAYQTKISKDGLPYTVFFVGTEDGKILKFLETKRGQLNILEEVTLIPEGGEVVALEMTKNGSALQVISSNQNDPFLLPLHRCSQMSKCSCPQDPFCIWNVEESECQEYDGLNSGEGFNQSVEAVDLCLRKEINEPLLMSANSLLQPTTTVEDIMDGPKGAEVKSNPKEDPSGVPLVIIVVIISATVILGVILPLGYLVYRKCIKTHRRVSNHETTSTWNSIEITTGNSRPRWRLQGVKAEPDKVKNWVGSLVKLKFKDLSPMTSYTIMRDNEQIEKISTKGPSVEILSDSLNKTSVEVRVSNMDPSFQGEILMTPLTEALSSHVQKKPIPTDGEVIRMDSLFPNVDYILQIKLEELNTKGKRQPFIKDVQSVRTEGEKFTIQSDEHGGDYLVWDKNDIDTRISEVIFSGCCLDMVSGSPSDGSLYLEKLPEIENMMFEVKAKMMVRDSCVEYQVAKSICDQRNRESFGFERDCVKNFSFLTALRPDVRRPLANKVVVKQAVYKAYCQALGHAEVKADVYWATVHDVDDKFLQPLREIHVDRRIKVLTKGLHETFIDLSKHKTRDNLEDCRQIYRVMKTLVDRHGDCPACSVIYSRLRHEWVCSGLESELQRQLPANRNREVLEIAV